ncbi:hypothetical protein [Sinomonas halotolerans]|uniref:DUF3887 domain-containing protein n=1 Tax=Sinomonas halotolerans TaxID=1644133 RepID=A0ABU9WW62_9MICC
MTFPRLPDQRPRGHAGPPGQPWQAGQAQQAGQPWAPAPDGQPASTGRRWLWVGLGAGMAALAGAAVAAIVLAGSVFSPDAAVRRASEQMSADLASGSTASAYAQFTPALRDHLSESALTSALTELGVGGLCRADFPHAESLSRAGQRPSGEARGYLVCGSRSFDVAFRWEGDPLRLDALRILPR